MFQADLSTEELVTIIFRAFPYHEQINDLDIKSEAISFLWRSVCFRITNSLNVTTSPHNDSLQIITRMLLRRTYGNYLNHKLDMEAEKEKLDDK